PAQPLRGAGTAPLRRAGEPRLRQLRPARAGRGCGRRAQLPVRGTRGAGPMSVISASAALAVALVLLAAAVGHLRDARGTRAALAAHDVLPSGLQRVAALLLPPVELLRGAGLLFALLGGSPLLTLVAGTATGLLAGFAAY